MTRISLKLPEHLLETTNRCAEALQVTRAEYIRRAVTEKNERAFSLLRQKRLGAASRRVRLASMRINSEFTAVERDIDS